MDKGSGKKAVVFGLMFAAAVGLVTWGFAALKSGIANAGALMAGSGEVVEGFGGLGVEITKKDGAIVVVETVDGTPAQKAGVEAGDRIVKINDEDVGDGPSIEDVVSKLRGEPGTEVTIGVQRGDETKTFTIKREKIKVPVPRIRFIERKGPRIEEWGPEGFWPFGEDWPWVWRGDKKALEDYREALRKLRDARRNLWRSFPRPPMYWEWESPELFAPEPLREKGEFRMEMDVQETDDAITIKCDIPGMKKEDIGISLKGNLLTIKGERSVEEEKKDEKGRIVRRERRFGSFSRSFTLPGKIKTEDIKTSYENGVLTVVIPKVKAEPEKEKEIKIKIGTI